MDELGYGILTEEETEKLILSLAAGQSEFTEDEAETVLKWAHEIKVYGAVIILALQGDVVLSVDINNEVVVRLPNGKEFDILDSPILV